MQHLRLYALWLDLELLYVTSQRGSLSFSNSFKRLLFLFSQPSRLAFPGLPSFFISSILFLCLCLCLFLFPSLSLSVSVCLCLSVSVSLCLCLSLSLSVSLCLSLSLSLSLCLSLSLSVSLSLFDRRVFESCAVLNGAICARL